MKLSIKKNNKVGVMNEGGIPTPLSASPLPVETKKVEFKSVDIRM